jgi:maltose alpha-D-glucosyltransferase/alpha-amylase
MKPDWLKDAVIYQIYPQSFQDTKGDGIGDIPGIISRLDYIRSIGANTIWMNPCFDSPFNDAGYDVRDFYKVADRYGTEADLVNLFEEAHKRGMRVLLDLVAGHTSIDHPWFIAEAANPRDPDSNRYIWKNRDFDPAAGPGRDDFVANFFWHQPALNFGYENPSGPWQDPVDAPGPKKNRRELVNIMDYWFSRGCDGFRVDMASSLVKGDAKVKPSIIALWNEIRSWMEKNWPEAILLAEWSDPATAIDAGFHLDFMIHFGTPGYPSLFFNGKGTLPAREGPCYFDSAGRGSIELFRRNYNRHLKATRGKGYISLPTANHDFQRLRCGKRGWEGLRPAWVFLMTQAGIPVIYYGDEIGMRFVEDTPAKEGSTLTGIIAPNAGGADGERAGTRTPMQWNKKKNAGFSTANRKKLYLPLDPDKDRPTVAAQENDHDSLLNFVRRLLEIRRTHPALGAEGVLLWHIDRRKPYPMVYERRLGDERILILINPSGKRTSRKLPVKSDRFGAILVDGCEYDEEFLTFSIKPFGFGIFSIHK